MKLLTIVIVSVILVLNTGCGRSLVSNLKEYETVDSQTKYKILSENDKGFELAVFIKSSDFYTEERFLIAKAKNKFRGIAHLICAQKTKEMHDIDDNAFIDSADLGSKTALVRNWIYYKD